MLGLLLIRYYIVLFCLVSIISIDPTIAISMNKDSSSSATSSPTATCCTTDGSSVSNPRAKRRHSWSGSRKINVSEDGAKITTKEQHKIHNIPINNNHDKVNENLEDRQNFISSLIAGVGSGSLASVVCAPLDLVRTRMQVAGGLQGKSAQAQSHAKIIKSLQEIYISDGLRGCFRGLGATLATVPAFWGLYFPLYERFKCGILDWSNQYGNGGNNHHALVHLSSAISAGAVADIICNPMFVVRTRMQTEALHYFQMPVSERRPHNIMTTVVGMYKEAGIPIFWRGLTASLLGLGHVGIQFPVYERLKAEARKRSANGEESPIDLLLASGLSKMCAAVITYPHEVIRSRMMDARGAVAGKNVYRTAQHIVKNEGYTGLYAGIRVSLFRVVPNCCVTFVSYELIARWVRSQMNERNGIEKEKEND